jgi:hypothetical protein
MTVSAVFTTILRAGRPQFNAGVTAARHRYPGFKTDAFAAFLETGVDPLVLAVHEVAPDYAGSVAVAAYDIALDLVGRELAGPQSRSEHMNTLWQRIFPVLALRVAENPQLVLGALSNALVNIESLPSARPAQWLELMQQGAAQSSTSEQLLQTGVVAAWRAGAAHFRQAALRLAAALPEALVRYLIGADTTLSQAELLQNIATNPWWLRQLQHRSEAERVTEVGAFSGFGGAFAVPPEVRVNEDGFIVKSGERYHLLIADAFGAVLLPASEEEFSAATKCLPGNSASAPAHQPQLQGNRLIRAGKALRLDMPESGLALAFNEHSIALYSPCSFAITLVPR